MLSPDRHRVGNLKLIVIRRNRREWAHETRPHQRDVIVIDINLPECVLKNDTGIVGVETFVYAVAFAGTYYLFYFSVGKDAGGEFLFQ